MLILTMKDKINNKIGDDYELVQEDLFSCGYDHVFTACRDYDLEVEFRIEPSFPSFLVESGWFNSHHCDYRGGYKSPRKCPVG